VFSILRGCVVIFWLPNQIDALGYDKKDQKQLPDNHGTEGADDIGEEVPGMGCRPG
jgi:hypothetical protein